MSSWLEIGKSGGSGREPGERIEQREDTEPSLGAPPSAQRRHPRSVAIRAAPPSARLRRAPGELRPAIPPAILSA
jgi:hypothetical protein